MYPLSCIEPAAPSTLPTRVQGDKAHDHLPLCSLLANAQQKMTFERAGGIVSPMKG